MIFLTTFYYFKKERIKDFDGYRLYLNITEYTSWLMYFTKYEEKEVKFVINNLKCDDNSLDIGSNIGFYTILFASLSKKGIVYSFEANSENFDKLSKNIKLNEINNVRHFNRAVSNDSSYKYLISTKDINAGGHYISLTPEKKYEKVHTIDLNNTLNKDIFFQIVKIDVEGHEIEVLKGMSNILKRNTKFLIIETSGNFREIKNYLTKFEFVVLKRYKLNSIFKKNKQDD
tara:strand:+ start:1074 stop:1763 length:690 start_codon:yes stop_codon:yes gene_type:complete